MCLCRSQVLYKLGRVRAQNGTSLLCMFRLKCPDIKPPGFISHFIDFNSLQLKQCFSSRCLKFKTS